MKIEFNTKDLVSSKLTPDQYVLLFCLYHKDFDTIKQLFSKNDALLIRNTLLGTKYILSQPLNIFETVLSKKEVERLLGIKGDNINFHEFNNCYPVKVGTRVLRASGSASQLFLKHEKKYLSKVKTEEQHQSAIKAITTFVAKQKMSGKLDYLPAMDSVVNNALWQTWEVLIEKKGEENGQWNSEII